LKDYTLEPFSASAQNLKLSYHSGYPVMTLPAMLRGARAE